MVDFSRYFISGDIRITKSPPITDHKGVHVGDADARIIANIQLCDIKICYFSIAKNGLLCSYEARFPVDCNHGGINYF